MVSNPSAPDDSPRRVVFSAPELLDVRKALQDTAQAHRDDGATVWFNGDLIDDHIEAKLRYADPEDTHVLTMKAAVAVEPNNAKALLEARAGIVEFIGGMFEQWLSGTGQRSPGPDWKEYSYGGQEYRFCGTLINEKIESEADAFLRAHGVDPDHLDETDPEDLYADAIDADVVSTERSADGETPTE